MKAWTAWTPFATICVCFASATCPTPALIICSMEGERNYPEIDLLMADPEFEDMIGKVVITAEPNYLARFSSSNQVVSYQRRFMNAAKGMK